MFFLNRKCLHKYSFKIISNPETTKISCNCLPSIYLRVNPEYRHFWYTRTDGQLFINRYSSQIFFWGCFPENICRPVPLVRACTVCTTIYLSYIYITPSDFIVQLSLVKWSWPIDNWEHRWGGHIGPKMCVWRGDTYGTNSHNFERLSVCFWHLPELQNILHYWWRWFQFWAKESWQKYVQITHSPIINISRHLIFLY